MGEQLHTIGEWLERVTSDTIADADAFAKRWPDPLLVAVELDPGSKGSESGATEMLDAAKIKSGVLASRDARVYVVPRKPASAEIVVGRVKGCDVWIDDTRVSKKHAAFVAESGGFTLHDLGSTNGTFVNERKLDKGERAPVKPHDQIRFGRATKMHFMNATGFFDYLTLLRRFGI